MPRNTAIFPLSARMASTVYEKCSQTISRCFRLLGNSGPNTGSVIRGYGPQGSSTLCQYIPISN